MQARARVPNHVTFPLGTLVAAYVAVWTGVAPLPQVGQASEVSATEFRALREQVVRIDTRTESHGAQIERIERWMDRYARRRGDMPENITGAVPPLPQTRPKGG